MTPGADLSNLTYTISTNTAGGSTYTIPNTIVPNTGNWTNVPNYPINPIIWNSNTTTILTSHCELCEENLEVLDMGKKFCKACRKALLAMKAAMGFCEEDS